MYPLITSSVGENKGALVLDFGAIPQSGRKLNECVMNFWLNDILCLKFFYRVSYLFRIRSRELSLPFEQMEVPKGGLNVHHDYRWKVLVCEIEGLKLRD